MARSQLFYDEPASRWVEALPVGNGRLGAMVFGGLRKEHLQLNEDSVWAGAERVREQPGGPEALVEIRDLLFAGRHEEAEARAQERLLSPRLTRSYQSLGDLWIDFEEDFGLGAYRRGLDLMDGVATCRRQRAQGEHIDEWVFASAPRSTLVVRCLAAEGARFDARVSLTRPSAASTRHAGPKLFVLAGDAREEGLSEAGVRFEARLRWKTHGGSSRVEASSNGPVLVLEGVNGVDLFLTAATSYRGQADFVRSEAASIAACDLGFDALLAEHRAEHRSWMQRFDLQVDDAASAELEASIAAGRKTSAASIPTDERIAAAKAGRTDVDLLPLYVQFARYLLLASSRPASLPANLQGLWCEHVEKAPWNCDYHININIQMNYWPAGPLNLSELEGALFDWADGLMRRGRETAFVLYGCRGFVAHHTSDAWHFTVPVGRTSWGLWPCGAAWLATMYVDHWRFTRDIGFARERAWPFVRGAAEFFCDWLVPDPETGLLVSGPSMSPENGFVKATKRRLHVDMGPAMDGQIIAQLFDDLIEVAGVLDRGDDPVVQEVQRLRPRLAVPRVGSDGRLLEWRREVEEHEPGHRHISHAYALFPGRSITPLFDAELARALRATIDARLARGGGHTGWSRAWIACLFARLADGDACLTHLDALLAKSTLPNLMDDHPPFQIDGNFGGAAAVAALLVQDQKGVVDVLPALPRRWVSGRVRGLKARGGLVLDLRWEGAALRDGKIAASHTMHYRLRMPRDVRILDGQVEVAHARAGQVIEVELVAGRHYELRCD